MVSRYGVKLRKKYDEIKRKQTAKYVCPKCGKRKVHRKCFAEWECRSCGVIFAGRAFEPQTESASSVKKALEGSHAKPGE